MGKRAGQGGQIRKKMLIPALSTAPQQKRAMKHPARHRYFHQDKIVRRNAQIFLNNKKSIKAFPKFNYLSHYLCAWKYTL